MSTIMLMAYVCYTGEFDDVEARRLRPMQYPNTKMTLILTSDAFNGRGSLLSFPPDLRTFSHGGISRIIDMPGDGKKKGKW
jgi:hypothetical protein